MKKYQCVDYYNHLSEIYDLFLDEKITFTKHEIYVNKRYKCEEIDYCSRDGLMKNDILYKKIYTEILEDEEIFKLIKHILDLDILKNYYSAPIFYAKKPNKEVYIAAKEESLSKEFEFFKNKIFNKNFFKDYIILDYLPYSVKAVTTNFMRIIYNFSRKGVKFVHLFTDYYNEKDLKTVIYCII